jgi:hypothetical protein
MRITPFVVSLDNKDINTRNITEISVWRIRRDWPPILWGVLIFFTGLVLCYVSGYGLIADFLYAELNISIRFLNQLYGNFIQLFSLNYVFNLSRQIGHGYVLVAGSLITGSGMFLAWPLVAGPKYSLILQTSAGKVTALQSKDLKFLQAVQGRIREVINASGEVSTYSINVDNKTIQEGNKVHVSDSQGVNVVGGAATNVSQTAEVHGAAMKDLTALIAQLDSLGQADTQEMKQLLSDVRMYLAGAGKSKEDAKSSWDQFVERLGKAADVTDDIWSLVVKIGAAVT